MVTIRDATHSDIPRVLAFWRDATTVASSTDDPESIAALLEHDPHSLLVATDDDAIVGTVIIGFDGWRGAMYRLAVAPAHRRERIATALVDEGKQRLRARGARRLHMI